MGSFQGAFAKLLESPSLELSQTPESSSSHFCSEHCAEPVPVWVPWACSQVPKPVPEAEYPQTSQVSWLVSASPLSVDLRVPGRCDIPRTLPSAQFSQLAKKQLLGTPPGPSVLDCRSGQFTRGWSASRSGTCYKACRGLLQGFKFVQGRLLGIEGQS